MAILTSKLNAMFDRTAREIEEARHAQQQAFLEEMCNHLDRAQLDAIPPESLVQAQQDWLIDVYGKTQLKTSGRYQAGTQQIAPQRYTHMTPAYQMALSELRIMWAARWGTDWVLQKVLATDSGEDGFWQDAQNRLLKAHQLETTEHASRLFELEGVCR